MQYVADQELTGKLVVTFRWAQYAIAAFNPRSHGDDGLLVAFDGRFRTCYPQEIVDMYFDFATGLRMCREHKCKNYSASPGASLKVN